MVKLETLTELFDHLNFLLDNGHSLIDLGDILLNYDGDDYIKHIPELILNKPYTKRILFSNEVIELVIINWSSKSGIHDHAKNGCLTRVLSGSLIETKYTQDLVIIKETVLVPGIYSFIASNKVLHDVVSKCHKTISLHIYSPPNHKTNFFT